MRYQYDREGRIVSVTDQNGVNYLNNSYDEKGRVVRQDLANGEEHIFMYDDALRRTTYCNIHSGARIVHYYNEKKQNIKTEYDDGTTQELVYDEWDNRIQEKGRDGEITPLDLPAGREADAP